MCLSSSALSEFDFLSETFNKAVGLLYRSCTNHPILVADFVVESGVFSISLANPKAQCWDGDDGERIQR